ncbi:MAG: hypothetical protein C4527_11595 [Candidatus Omnitrophota bacterium]|jgi:hypothetical protein|nr:MAG: hypothetical protein C4527_11595 [Candidatus Omnitrophota bacterium]
MRKTWIFVFLSCVIAIPAVAAEKWDITWTDYGQNPIDLSVVGDRAYMPYALYNENWPAESRYRIWYDYASIQGIAYAESADGVVWTRQVKVNGLNTEGESFAGRPVVLYEPSWSKPFRIYYYGNPGGIWQIRAAESSDGINFENDQKVLSTENSSLGTYPDGHAILYMPGQNEPFRMFYRGSSAIMVATSIDGFDFLEFYDVVLFPPAMQPTCAISIGQNDYRMWGFISNTANQYLVSSDGFNWEVWEDPVKNVGGLGSSGAWNDNRNYYASAVYLGNGRFKMFRSGRNEASGLYRIGVADGYDAHLAQIDIGNWDVFSPLDNYQNEGWEAYGTNAQGVLTQNADGTVSITDDRADANFYMVHDTAWVVPFTVEASFRIDEEGGNDANGPHCTIACMINDDMHPGSESWQPSFALTRFGGWNLNGTDPIFEHDLSGFNTFTVVCRFDEEARYLLFEDPNNSAANNVQSAYDVYLNRDFSKPAVTFHGTGWAGWPEVDEDGRLDIGWPNPSTGTMTVDWVRWGSGVILDPNDPGTPVQDWSVY